MKIFFKCIVVIQTFFALFNIFSVQCLGANNIGNELNLKAETIVGNFDANSNSINKNNSKITSEFKYLSDCGYPEKFLNNVSDTTLENIVKLLESNTITHLETKTEYWPQTSEQDAKVKITSIVANLQDNQTMKNNGSTVCVYWEWLDDKPIFRGKDFISIKWDNEDFCFASGSFYAEDYWRESVLNDWCVSNSYTTLSAANQNSIGHWTDLKEFKNQVGGILIFKLSPTNSDKNIDNIIDDLNISYNHNYDFIVISTTVIVIFIIFFFVVRFKLKKKSEKSKES